MTSLITLKNADFSNVTLPEGAIPPKIPTTGQVLEYRFFDPDIYNPDTIGTDYDFVDSSGNGHNGTLTRALLAGDEWLIQNNALVTKKPATAYSAAIDTGYIREPGPFTMIYCGTKSSQTSYYMKSMGGGGINFLSSSGFGYQLNDGANVIGGAFSHTVDEIVLGVMASDGGTSLEFYESTGAQLSVDFANPPTNQPDGIDTTDTLSVLVNSPGSNGQAFVGSIYYVSYYNRMLSTLEVSNLTKALRAELANHSIII